MPEPAVSLIDWQPSLQTLYLPVEEFNRLFYTTFPLIIEHLKVALHLNVRASHKSAHAADIRMYLNQLVSICKCLKDNKIEILDENELQEALNNKEITKEQFDLANKTKDELVKTIKDKTNKYMNINVNKYLN